MFMLNRAPLALTLLLTSFTHTAIANDALPLKVGAFDQQVHTVYSSVN